MRAARILWLDDWRRDVGYAARDLFRNPGFAAAAVVTLALGIGATTAVFSVVNAVLLQPLPYTDSDRLVRIVERLPARSSNAPPARRSGMTWTEFSEWRTRSTTLSAMAYTLTPPITLMPTAAGSARLTGALVSSNTIGMLGGRTLLGRVLDARDDAAGSKVVVLSAGAWHRYFQADPDIVGRTIALKTLGPEAGFLDGTPLTVVGVMHPSFDFPSPVVDFWAPITEDSPARRTLAAGVVARLRDGVSLQAAADEANAIGEGLRPKPASGPVSQPLPPGVRRFDVEAVKEQVVAPSRPALRVLAVAVGILLLIVCANVANLLLARGTSRRREIAIRLAVGASRGRVVRQLLAESFVLAIVGGVLGAALAIGGVWLVRESASPHAQGAFLISFGGAMLPRLHEIVVDSRVLGVSIAVAAVTALLVGIVPALKMSRIDHAHALSYRGAGGGGGGPRGDRRLRDGLVVAQVAMAMMLLIGAGLLINSFNQLSRVDPGWNASGILTFYLIMPQDYSTARKGELVERLIDELRALPRVQSAGFTYAGPLLGLVDQFGTFVPQGRTPDEMRGNPDNPQIRAVSYDYLQTMGVRLIAGRWFDARDDAAAPPVVIVNRLVMRRLFGDENPVGQFVHLDGRMEFAPQQIVGVVEDMRQARLDLEAAPQMFVDYRQVLAMTQARKLPTATQERLAFGFLSFVVRTEGDPAELMPTVRSLVGRVDRTAGIDAMLPMEQLVASSLTRQRFYALILGVFALIAAALAAIGTYGVLAYAVGRRTNEIGVRMALGAQRRDVLRLVLRRGLMVAAIGMILGLAGAAGVSRSLAVLLYGLTPLDPTTYLAVTGLFGFVVVLASYLPARRATKVDPMIAIRCE
jgi:putative ABC transport system permease protein